MKELLDKLSSYNIFNYLFPGVLFAVMGERIGSMSLMHDNLIVSAFLCYFYGLIVSRIGSLVVEPFLKKIKVVKFAEYREYVAASKSDNKIEVLSEQNNSYRTLIALVLILLVSVGVDGLRRYLGYVFCLF